MTNLERIKNMNAEEFCHEYEDVIISIPCEVCPAERYCTKFAYNNENEPYYCALAFQMWLESEVEE